MEVINIPASKAWHAVGADPLISGQAWTGQINLCAKDMSPKIRNAFLWAAKRLLCPSQTGSTAVLFKWWAMHNKLPYMLCKTRGRHPNKIIFGNQIVRVWNEKQIDAVYTMLEQLVSVWRLVAPVHGAGIAGVPVSSRRTYIRSALNVKEFGEGRGLTLVTFSVPAGKLFPVVTLSHLWRDQCVGKFVKETPTTNVEFQINFGKGDKG